MSSSHRLDGRLSSFFPTSIMADPQSPPPAYELSQQDYDQKTSEALALSERTHEDEWETWDDAVHEAAAQQGAGGSNAASSSAAEAPRYQYPSDPSAFGAAFQPLNINKKGALQSKVKERPSWLEEAGLGESGSSSALHHVEAERSSTHNRSREAIGGSGTVRTPLSLSSSEEADNAISPPPFTEVAPVIQPSFLTEIPQPSPVVTYHGNGSNPPSPLSSPTARITPLPTPPPPPPLLPPLGHPQGRSSPNPLRQSLPTPRRHHATTVAARPTTSLYGRGALPAPPVPRMTFDPSIAYERRRGDAQPQVQFQSPAYDSLYK